MPNESAERHHDWAVAPGEVLLEALEERGLSQAELARRMDRPLKTINEIVNGKAAITPETAIQLERTLGISEGLWNGLETNYRRALARAADRTAIESAAEFVTNFPVRDLKRLGQIPSDAKSRGDQLDALLRFFGVSSPAAWERRYGGVSPALRESAAFKSEPAAVASWLRIGELRAEAAMCGTYDEAAFAKVVQASRSMSRLTPPTTVLARMARQWAEAGVILLFVPELGGTHLNGAAFTTQSGRRVVQLSLRHKTDDQVWFTLLHEARHILDRVALVVDTAAGGVEKTAEARADDFARETLIPTADLERFLEAGAFNALSVQAFAKEIGVSPGIVAGRLERDGHVAPGQLRRLKATIAWAKTV